MRRLLYIDTKTASAAHAKTKKVTRPTITKHIRTVIAILFYNHSNIIILLTYIYILLFTFLMI